MSFDLHRRGQRADPLVPLVPHHEDDIAAIRYGVVAREEAYLEARFGVAYQDYNARVRRWL